MKDIKGYEGRYAITKDGRVWSYPKAGHGGHRGKWLQLQIGIGGYLIIGLCPRKYRKMYKVHRLVAEAYIANSKKKPHINHIDGNKTNNNVGNLEWVTKGENEKHKYRTLHIRHPMQGRFGKDSPRSKPVNQYTLNGKFIAKYDGMSEAQRKTGILGSNISAVIRRRRKTTGGFIWKLT